MQNGRRCKEEDTPKTQTATNPSQQLQIILCRTWIPHSVGNHLHPAVRGKNRLRQQNVRRCKEEDIPKTQTVTNPSQQLQIILCKLNTKSSSRWQPSLSSGTQQKWAWRLRQASTAKARMADSAKKKALQNPKQRKNPFIENSTHQCRSFFIETQNHHVLAAITIIIVTIIIIIIIIIIIVIIIQLYIIIDKKLLYCMDLTKILIIYIQVKH